MSPCLQGVKDPFSHAPSNAPMDMASCCSFVKDTWAHKLSCPLVHNHIYIHIYIVFYIFIYMGLTTIGGRKEELINEHLQEKSISALGTKINLKIILNWTLHKKITVFIIMMTNIFWHFFFNIYIFLYINMKLILKFIVRFNDKTNWSRMHCIFFLNGS